MKILGCDLHAKQQSIAMLDTETGELTEKTLSHKGNEVREFYAALEGRVVVGIEATFDFLGLTHICARSRRGEGRGAVGASRRSPNGARSTGMHRWTSSRRPSTPSSEATTSTTADRRTLRA